jgi:hypothetical protein
MHQSTDVKPGPNKLTEQLEYIVVALKVEAARKRLDKEVGLRSYTSFRVSPHLSTRARRPDRSWAKSLQPGKLPNASA